MLGSGNTVFHSGSSRLPSYNIIASLPPEIQNNPKVDLALRFFRVNLSMVMTYVLDAWTLIAASEDDNLYAYCAEDISEGNSIFYVDQTETSMPSSTNYFMYFEVLMDLIFRLRDHLRYSIANAVDPTNECDATQLTCKAFSQDCVVIGVQPSYEPGT